MAIPVLTGPLVLAGISALLAAIIAVVDSIVNNYGDCRIDINSGKKILKVKGGAPLLTTLGEQGIYLPSACGGRGSCGPPVGESLGLSGSGLRRASR